jgi:lysozyme
MRIDPQLVADLKRDEGVRLKPYRDTVGKLTIGIGRNLDDVGISQGEAEFLLMNDIQSAHKHLAQAAPIFARLDAVRQRVLLNMAFNMGTPRLMTFRKMWDALDLFDYAAAADEMERSKWATQVGMRATRLAQQMRAGEVRA